MVTVGDFEQGTTALFVCDYQRYYRDLLNTYDYKTINNKYLIKFCEQLNIPIIFTKHKGYGDIEPALESDRHKVFEKTKYSMWDSSLSQYIKEQYPNLKSILITGYETHVCLYQTAMDLVKNGYEAHIVIDASSSVDQFENGYALKRIKQISGAFVLSTEMVMLQLIKDDIHPNTEITYKLNSERIQMAKDLRIQKLNEIALEKH